MGRRTKKLTRRDFLLGATGVAALGAIGAAAGERETSEKAAATVRPKRARVILVRDEKVLDEDGRLDAGRLEQMLDQAVSTLLDEQETSVAWRRLVAPSDTVGIKSNEWSYLPTPRELERAIRQRLINAGVAEDRIAISDRGVLRHPVFEKATALINVRPMRTHHWAGVGSLIKNYIMFTEQPSAWHGDSCANLAGLWELPQVKGKTRLNILVMLTPQFHSKGPHGFSRKYVWSYKGLLVGLDPTSVDATGLRIIMAKRREFFGADQPLYVSPKHIEVAEKKFGLGVADPSRIDLVRLGWSEQALI
ncbi:MAG: hypothetical protein JSV80_03910 [Acidobacteriota bacterium]|nr:MAG: hypothetical protein JSV80_03910 [Acidobacteriota bacterium]